VTRRGDIVVCALPGDYGKPRPALVIQNPAVAETGFGSVLVCPLTSDLSGIATCRVILQPTPVTGLRVPSEVMVEKVTAVSAARLRERIGRADAASLAAVERALLWVLGIGER
jgi:mRNA interferase MazF